MFGDITFNQQLYQKVLDNLNTAVFYLNAEMEVLYVNPAAEMLLKTSKRKIEGKTFNERVRASESLVNRMRNALVSGHSFTEREINLGINGSKAVTVDCTVNVIHEPGQPEFLLIEFVQIDRQLRITREEALIEQQNATRKLLRGMSHEIKNPLGGIRGAAQLLEMELDDDRLKEYTGIIVDETERLKNLVDRMLGPNELPSCKKFNIHEVLERVYGLIRIESPKTEVVRDYDPSIPDMYADPEQMIQAILNLARNSIQAMDYEGRIILKSRTRSNFTIGSLRHKLVLLVEVIDNGPGIPSEIADRIFFPMITGRVEGTGLGLSIAQSIINRQGGVIEYESRPGRTAFEVLIPLERKNEA